MSKIAKETLYHNADRTKIVKQGDKDAVFLLAREGAVVTDEEIDAHDLSPHVKDQGEPDEELVVAYAPRSKAIDGAPENKALAMTDDSAPKKAKK